MPDISMCIEDKCPLAHKCYRHKKSGTRPSDPHQWYQEYKFHTDDKGVTTCDDYWDVAKRYG